MESSLVKKWLNIFITNKKSIPMVPKFNDAEWKRKMPRLSQQDLFQHVESSCDDEFKLISLWLRHGMWYNVCWGTSMTLLIEICFIWWSTNVGYNIFILNIYCSWFGELWSMVDSWLFEKNSETHLYLYGWVG